jgi:hypothetical protein
MVKKRLGRRTQQYAINMMKIIIAIDLVKEKRLMDGGLFARPGLEFFVSSSPGFQAPNPR